MTSFVWRGALVAFVLAACSCRRDGALTAAGTTTAATSPWPGLAAIEIVDAEGVFGENLSGLTYVGATGSTAAVLWAVRNGPSTLYRLTWNGTIFTPDAAGGWQQGKSLRYSSGADSPDAEGVAIADGAIYVAAERDNDANTVIRNSVLRYDARQAGAALIATNEWNLTSDLPRVGANLGIEAVTWLPDSFLTAHRFYDELARHSYVPLEYANHGNGLFVVGVEANGVLYAYALNHSDNSFKRIATIASGFAAVMALELDPELGYLWATCDDGCGNKAATLEIDATSGRFVPTHVFDRPAAMPNLNNEGFALAPQSECVNNLKHVFWADDGATGGHSVRRGTVPCTRFP